MRDESESTENTVMTLVQWNGMVRTPTVEMYLLAIENMQTRRWNHGRRWAVILKILLHHCLVASQALLHGDGERRELGGDSP